MTAAQDSPEAGGIARISLNVSSEVGDLLKGYAEGKNMSQTAAAVRAIRLLAYVDEAMTRGAHLFLEEDGNRVELVLL
jgi:hypothetical protein